MYLQIARNETFTFNAGPSIQKMQVNVYDHKTLGKDKPLGEAEIEVSSISEFFALISPSTDYHIFSDLATHPRRKP